MFIDKEEMVLKEKHGIEYILNTILAYSQGGASSSVARKPSFDGKAGYKLPHGQSF